MAEALDHPSAQAVFQRVVARAPFSDGELDRALAHAATCDLCYRQFEVGRTAACREVEEDLPDAARVLRSGEDLAGPYPAVAAHLQECERCTMILAELVSEPVEASGIAEVPIDPPELFERALTAALTDPDATTRQRAAERLGGFERLGAPALAELARAAAEDDDEEVRAGALRALDQLDASVSISERLIQAWSASPPEAVPFIGEVLGRLAGEGPPDVPGVTELVAGEGEELTLAGKEEIAGAVTEEKKRLWLTLTSLPSRFENTKPVVAVPGALERDPQPIQWSGKEPGLVSTAERVTGGSVKIGLGRVPKKGAVEKRELFKRVYLLTPETRRADRNPEEGTGRGRR